MKSLTKRSMTFFLGNCIALLLSLCFFNGAYAAGPTNLSLLVTSVQSGLLVPILNVVVSISYLAGAAFIVASIFKFKAHKDNPTQVTVGTPVMLLFVGVALLFMPALIDEIMNSLGFTTTSGGSLTFTGAAGGYIGTGA